MQMLEAGVEKVAPYSGPTFDTDNFYKTVVSVVNSAMDSGLVIPKAGDSLNQVVDDAAADPD
jgi:hypothetical protein